MANRNSIVTINGATIVDNIGNSHINDLKTEIKNIMHQFMMEMHGYNYGVSTTIKQDNEADQYDLALEYEKENKDGL